MSLISLNSDINFETTNCVSFIFLLISGFFKKSLKSIKWIPILSFKTLLSSVLPEYLFPIIEYMVGYKHCFTSVFISPIFLLFISISRIIEYGE